MKSLITLFLLMFSLTANAYDLNLVELNQLDMEYFKIANNRNDYVNFPDANAAKPGQEHWTDGAAITWNLNLISLDEYRVYWDNKVQMADTSRQVREVGWEWETGLALDSKVDIYWHHHSQHALDMTEPGMGYPLQNMYGVRFHIYTRE